MLDDQRTARADNFSHIHFALHRLDLVFDVQVKLMPCCSGPQSIGYIKSLQNGRTNDYQCTQPRIMQMVKQQIHLADTML